jgi:4-amino-4-deoxy-L-arabinose transferase-like glycosyltransferase
MSVAMSDQQEKPGIVLTEEQKRRQRSRSIALALVLAALVVLIWAVTLAKGPGGLPRY